MGRVLFICTGNYYRSRFAEEMFNHLAGGAGLPWRADSQGLAVHLIDPALDGTISPHALRALRARGIPPAAAGRPPAPFNRLIAFRYNMVVAINRREHEPMLLQACPETAARTLYWDVGDVGEEDATAAMSRIEALVRELVASIAEGRAP